MENVYADDVYAGMVERPTVTVLLRQLRTRAGLSMEEMGHALGLKGASGYQRYENEALFKKGFLPVDKVRRLAEKLAGRGDPPITYDEVYALAEPPLVNPILSLAPNSPGSKVVGERGVVLAPPPEPEDTRDLLPVRSGGRGGPAQEMFLADGAIDFVPRPSYLKNVRSAYAIYMLGNSMDPRYKHGQILHVNPARPYGPGDGVVVTKKDNTVLVKEFVSRNHRALKLREYEPKRITFEVPLDEVVDVDRIVAAIDS